MYLCTKEFSEATSSNGRHRDRLLLIIQCNLKPLNCSAIFAFLHIPYHSAAASWCVLPTAKEFSSKQISGIWNWSLIFFFMTRFFFLAIFAAIQSCPVLNGSAASCSLQHSQTAPCLWDISAANPFCREIFHVLVISVFWKLVKMELSPFLYIGEAAKKNPCQSV